MENIPWDGVNSFIDLYRETRNAMIDYYSCDNSSIIKDHEKYNLKLIKDYELKLKNRDCTKKEYYSKKINRLKDKTKYFPSSNRYESLYKELSSKEHMFLKWLDCQPCYKSAESKFNKKIIFHPCDVRYKDKDIPLISLNSKLNFIIANSLLFLKRVKRDGTIGFIPPTEENWKKIKNKAKSLLNDINSLPGIRPLVAISVINQLERLASKDTTINEIKRVRRTNDLVMLGKDHKKAERELFIKFLCREYGRRFGLYEQVPKNTLKDETNLVSCLSHPFLNQHQTQIQVGHENKVWVTRLDSDNKLNYSIHADVLVDVISLIHEYAEDGVTERKIFEIAKKQKIHDASQNINIIFRSAG